MINKKSFNLDVETQEKLNELQKLLSALEVGAIPLFLCKQKQAGGILPVSRGVKI